MEPAAKTSPAHPTRIQPWRSASKKRRSLWTARRFTFEPGMSEAKVVLLGAGFIADIHIESYHRFVPDAEVVAVYARKRERAESFASKHHLHRWFTDFEQAIHESDAEVVDICLPNFLHHRAVLASVKAGKHIIIEKPLAMTLEESDEMIAASQAANLK